MQPPSVGEYAPGYQKYFDLVPERDYLEGLQLNTTETVEFFCTVPAQKLGHRYADGKWTVNELLMHMIDTERVFSYRALIAARGDKETLIYRMDEELYARNVDVTDRSLPSLIEEFEAVRASTRTLFETVTDAQSALTCNIVTYPMTARAIGYFMIGHIRHHVKIIKERYL